MRVLRDGKWGILRQDGEVIVPCAYNLIGEPNAYGLIPVTSDGKHGFLGADGREVLPCFFSYISDFKDGYARTNYGGSMVLRDEPYGGQWGLIDTLGHETIPCRYYYLDTRARGSQRSGWSSSAITGMSMSRGMWLFRPVSPWRGPSRAGGRGELQQCQFRARRPQRR